MPCLQPDASAPTPPTNVGAKHFSPETQPATPHTLFATRPVSPNNTIQCRGEVFFARIATHKHLAPCIQPNQSAPTPTTNVWAKYFSPVSQTITTAYPVRNPTRQPPHHLPTCGRKIFRPYNILPICLIPVKTQPSRPTPPATVGARCAGVTRPRPPQRLYPAKSI